MRLSAFYKENPARQRSGEMDFGVWWTENGTRFPRFRLSVIQATGEVYTLRQDTTEEVEVLAVLTTEAGSWTSGREWSVYDEAERLLVGWADHCMSDRDGIGWVRDRLVSYASSDEDA